MYDEVLEGGKGKPITDDILNIVRYSFNPIPKIIYTLSNLAMNGDIAIINDDNNFVTEIMNYNNFDFIKLRWFEQLLLSKTLYIECVLQEDGNIKLIPHTSDKVKAIVDSSGKIIQAEIKNEEYAYNKGDEAYEKVEIITKYVEVDGVVRMTKENSDGQIVMNEVLIGQTRVPFVKIETNYSLSRAMRMTDDINLLAGYSHSILYHAGEPILSASGVKTIAEEGRERLAQDRFKKQKVLYSGFDTKLEVLEIKGTSVDGMRGLRNDMIDDLKMAYPELAISEATKGSNLSTESMRLKLREVVAIVENIRSQFMSGISDVIIAGAQLKRVETNGSIELPEIILADMTKTLNDINLAVQNNILSKASAMTLIQPMFLDGSVDNEIGRLKAEGIDIKGEEGLTTNADIEDEGGNDE